MEFREIRFLGQDFPLKAYLLKLRILKYIKMVLIMRGEASYIFYLGCHDEVIGN
jgi:hypothetical protein